MFGLVLKHRSNCAAKLSRSFLRLLLGQRLELADGPGLEERTSRPRLMDSFSYGCGPQWIVTDAVTMWTQDLRTAEEWPADRSTSERADLDVAQVCRDMCMNMCVDMCVDMSTDMPPSGLRCCAGV